MNWQKVFTILTVTTVVLIHPMEGHVSGSFSAVYGQEEYILSFDNQRHKIYYPGTVKRLYQQFHQDFINSITAKQDELIHVLDTWKAKGTPVVRMNLAWPEIALINARKIDSISAGSYPLVLALPIQNPEGDGLFVFKCAIESPIEYNNLKWFTDQLQTLLFREENAEHEINELESLVYPQAIYQRGKYALAAAAFFQTRPSALEFYTNQLQAILAKSIPALEMIMSNTANAQYVAELEEIRKATEAENLELDWFNIEGPIVDEINTLQFFRPRFDTPNVIVTALIASKKYPATKLTDQMTDALEESQMISPDQMRSIQRDLVIMRN